MKAILTLCVICLTVALVGCETTEDATSPVVSPGAVSECGVNCECCPNSPNYKDPNASLGAVNDAPSCSGSKPDASLGAVGDAKTCSGAKKTSCSDSKPDASLGAVSDVKSCCTSKKSDG